MIDYSKLAGDNIRNLNAYKPGKPIDELKREFNLEYIIKLASNENPIGPSPKIFEAIKENFGNISRYPLGDAYDLRMATAKKHNVKPEELVFGSGSNEIIELLLRTFVKAGEHVLSPAPSFSVYGIISQAMGSRCEWVKTGEDFQVDVDHLLAKIDDKTRVVFLSNPNNPTGTYINSDNLKYFLKKVPDNVIVVMDEAYIEFADAKDIPETVSWFREFPQMVIMRTFSKAYGLAGLRIGYSIASPECCDMMNRVRQPFNTNMVAQVAATVAVQDDEWLKKSVKVNTDGKYMLYKAFESMSLKYVPTQSNFMLVEVGNGEKVFNDLLRKGVIVRFMGPALKEYIRVSIGTKEENKIFLKALSEVL